MTQTTDDSCYSGVCLVSDSSIDPRGFKNKKKKKVREQFSILVVRMQICWELVLVLRLFQQVICMQSCQQEDWTGMEPEHAVTQWLGPEGFLGPWRRGCRCLALHHVLHVLYSGEMSALPVY